jgi:glycosyltransferase involved in cell wall biosynthesis
MFIQSLLLPSASICLATYNGNRYLEPLLRSILPNLEASDEIVIVDDHSSDSTVSIIQELKGIFSCTRMSITINSVNEGPVKAFEKAISLAKNDLIFLCDQDDVWLSHKISTYKTIFMSNPGVGLVASDHLVINCNGEIISTSFVKNYLPLGRFPYIPFLNHKNHGPSIAFRKSLLSLILPFPPSISSHDQWVAQVASLVSPSIRLPFPAQAYRLHSSQVTSSGRLPFPNQLRNRAIMMLNLLLRLFSR